MKKGWFIYFILLSNLVFAQIIDDSTELVYGAKTTQIIYQSHLKNNQPKEVRPDTSLYELEKFTIIDIANRKFQDLGNNGTALFPIFHTLPSQIGRTSGLNVYDPIMKTQEELKYYDSKSPHINLLVVFGGEGRSVVDMSFTRNISENWNVGFDIHRITSDKQIGKSGQQDRNAVTSIFDVYSYYQHSEIPYSTMFSITNSSFDIEETGGIYIEDLATANQAEFFEYQDSDIQLNEARATDKRLNIHLFHQYNWTKPLQFYHQLDIKTQTFGYQDFSGGGNSNYDAYEDYYDRLLIDADSTYDLFEWREVSNEIGIKGDLANLFYRVYLKRRDIDFDNLYQDPTDRFSETFIGGYTRFDWQEKFDVVAKAELLQSGEYQLKGNLNSDLIFASYTSMSYKPSFLQDKYFGNHNEWNNNFSSAFTNEIKGGINVDLGFLKVRPQARLLTRDGFFYFDEQAQSSQSNEIAVLTSLGGDFNFRVTTNRDNSEAFHFENEVYFTTISGDGADKMVVPQFFYNGRIFWRGAWFKDTMGVEIGADIHSKSAYYAMGFAPEVQQFHLQDEFEIDAFYTVDAFISMRVNNVRAFVKLVNINQQDNGGYFVTPYYPGQARTMDFGVRWLFFD